MDLTKFYPEKFSHRTAYKYIIYSYYFKDLTPGKTIAEKFAEKIMIEINQTQSHSDIFNIAYMHSGSRPNSMYIFERPIDIYNGKNYPFPFLVKELLSQFMSETFEQEEKEIVK